MKTVGSQIRERLEDSEYDLFTRIDAETVVLHNNDTGLNELFVENDDFAGHVIQIGDEGYEFIQTTDIWK